MGPGIERADAERPVDRMSVRYLKGDMVSASQSLHGKRPIESLCATLGVVEHTAGLREAVPLCPAWWVAKNRA